MVNNREWIIELGFPTFVLSDKTIMIRDNENQFGINCIILLTKKVIHNAMKNEKQPQIAAVKNELKNLYYQGKYRLCMKGCKKQFEKRYSFLKCIFENCNT